MAKKPSSTTPARQLERHIHTIRGQRVMLDADLAALYGVETKVFNQAVRRNAARFPDDFAFILTHQELANLRSQIVTSNPAAKMGLRRAPYAFTQEGVAMLSAVLRSARAVQTSILIMRAFTHMRELITTHKDLAARIDKLEQGHDRAPSVIEVLVEDIDRLAHEVKRMKALPDSPRRKIGFDL